MGSFVAATLRNASKKGFLHTRAGLSEVRTAESEQNSSAVALIAQSGHELGCNMLKKTPYGRFKEVENMTFYQRPSEEGLPVRLGGTAGHKKGSSQQIRPVSRYKRRLSVTHVIAH